MNIVRTSSLLFVVMLAVLSSCAINDAFERDPGLQELEKDASTRPARDASVRDASRRPADEDRQPQQGEPPRGDAAPDEAASGQGGQDAEDAVRAPDENGEVVDADASVAPSMSKIKGSALRANCTSSTPRKGEMCASYYCGVTQDDIAKELATPCPYLTPEVMCEGSLGVIASGCARDAVLANPLASEEEGGAAVLDCIVKQRPEVADAPTECHECLFAGLSCALESCVVQCIGGDSPTCNSCRIESGCQEQTYVCQGQPNPF